MQDRPAGLVAEPDSLEADLVRRARERLGVRRLLDRDRLVQHLQHAVERAGRALHLLADVRERRNRLEERGQEPDEGDQRPQAHVPLDHQVAADPDDHELPEGDRDPDARLEERAEDDDAHDRAQQPSDRAAVGADRAPLQPEGLHDRLRGEVLLDVRGDLPVDRLHLEARPAQPREEQDVAHAEEWDDDEDERAQDRAQHDRGDRRGERSEDEQQPFGQHRRRRLLHRVQILREPRHQVADLGAPVEVVRKELEPLEHPLLQAEEHALVYDRGHVRAPHRQKRVHDEDREQDADEDPELADAAVRDDRVEQVLEAERDGDREGDREHHVDEDLDPAPLVRPHERSQVPEERAERGAEPGQLAQAREPELLQGAERPLVHGPGGLVAALGVVRLEEAAKRLRPVRLQEEADERNRHDRAGVGREHRDLGSLGELGANSLVRLLDGRRAAELAPGDPRDPVHEQRGLRRLQAEPAADEQAGEVVHDRRSGILGLDDAEKPLLFARPRHRRPLLDNSIRQIDLDGLAEPVRRRREQRLERRDRLLGVPQLGGRPPCGV